MSITTFKKRLFTLFSVIFTLCPLIILIGCVSTEELGRMQWDINKLKSDIQKIKKKSQNFETQIPDQKKQINKKLQELEDTQKATAKTVSDLLIKVQDLTTEFQVLTGRFEEARYFSEKSSDELMESRDKLMAKLNELELAVADLKKKFSKLEAVKPTPQKEVKKEIQNLPKTGIKEGTQKAKIKDVYMAAYQAFKEGKTAQAREKFISLLNDYPENEYSDNARFWIAESYYQDKSYEDAILAYEELFRKNPDSDKVPGAMLKQGLAFYALKDKKTGKIILEKLIEKYPDSEQAKIARRKIKKIVPTKKKR